MNKLHHLWVRVATAVMALALAACAMPTTQDTAVSTEQYRAMLANPIRTERDRTMDERRRPVELLQFAQARPGMRVLDVVAGGGYTSQLLALAVGPTGKVWAQTPQVGAAMKDRLAANAQTGIEVVTRPFEDPVPPEATQLDLVTLVLNYHDISYMPVDRDLMNRRIFAALKPGGRYIVIDHSALAGTGITAGKTLHRIEEAFVVAEVQRAGFVFDGEGGFMRSAADTRDKSSNLPGSDKFVLRFVKPR